MPYQVFYIVRSQSAGVVRAVEDISKKEHYKTEQQALTRIRELCENECHHSILLAHGPDYVLSGFRLQLELDFGKASE
jgi:hypothetical protein